MSERDQRVVRVEEILLRDFPGELGAVDDLRSLDADLRDLDAKFSATKTLQTELRLANEQLATLRVYLRVSNERAEKAEQDRDKAVWALTMIEANELGESYSAGVAMSCLASIEEAGGAWGECHWHPGQPYTMALRLCNDDGVVETERLGEIVAYDCTGGAHRYGEHILCTSPAHAEGRA